MSTSDDPVRLVEVADDETRRAAARLIDESAGFVDIAPYAANSMRRYQAQEELARDLDSAVFMALDLRAARTP
ncbi:MAG: hypothetical protein HZC37_21835 [Burkholderiales bacterium]|nr:hypothetical protein [Burkholderiales bacterium]